MEPFSITCTTCHARLTIRDARIIGEIHACPRCSGMVQIVPPSNWKGEEKLSPFVENASSPVVADVAAAESDESLTTAANDQPSGELAAVAVVESEESWLADPRVIWIGVPVVAVLTAFVVWLFSGPTADQTVDGESVAQVEPAAKPEPIVAASAEAIPTSSATKSSSTEAEPAKTELSPEATSNSTPDKTPLAPLPSATPQPATPPAPPSKSGVVSSPASSVPPSTAILSPPIPPQTNVATQTPASNPSTTTSTTAPRSMLLPSSVATTTGTTNIPTPKTNSSEAINPPQVTLFKPEIAAHLATHFEEVQFPRATLYEFLQFVSRATTIPIAVDADALAERGITLTQPVVLKKYNLSAGELLKNVLGEIDLGYAVQDWQLLVTDASRDSNKLVSEAHSVSGLTPDTPEQIGELLKYLIEPDSWTDADGPGSLKVDGQSLVVSQTPAVQREVRRLLEKLRAARSPNSTNEALLRPRFRRADDKLTVPIKANFPGPTPLAQIVDHLRRAQPLMILVDHAALAADGKSVQLAASITVHDVPLADALAALLDPHELTYRVIDASTIEITTPSGSELRPDIEFYDLGKLAAAGDSADKIVAAFKQPLPDVRWFPDGRGTLAYDPVSKRVLVRHSQDVQRRVAELIKNSGN